MPKHSLRSQLLKKRRALTNAEWSASSLAAQINLLSLVQYKRADCIALYAPAKNETDTEFILLSALKCKKRVLYPVVSGNQMLFRQVERIESFQKGAFGILEPTPNGIDHQADEADLIVVPGVAFDTNGHRIGYGKGFYDRFLHHPGRKAHLIGLCHDFQLIEGDIPVETHDIPMEIVVTDKQIVRMLDTVGLNKEK